MKIMYKLFNKRNFKSITVFVVCFQLILINLSAQTGPGGVGNSTSNRLWLKADGNIYIDGGGFNTATNGDKIQDWNDCSGNANNAIQTITVNKPIIWTYLMIIMYSHHNWYFFY